jgi:hypothetical protein
MTVYSPTCVGFKPPANHGLSHHRHVGDGWLEVDLLDIRGRAVDTARFRCAP